MSQQLRQLLVVEDDPATREALRLELETDARIESVATAASLAEARAWLSRSEAEVLVLDVDLPDGNGLLLIPEAREQATPARCLVLSALNDEATIVQGIRLGAEGYLLKQDVGTGIADALFDVLAGRPPLSPAVAQCIMAQIREESREPGTPATGPSLPPRQQQTLSLLARGLTYQEIAEQMEISFHTVSAYAQEIYSKLAARSRSEAVFLAREMGLL